MPENVREGIKSISPDPDSNSSSLDDAIWHRVIESGIMKIPVVLVSFHEIGTQSLHAARLSRQGPGNLQTLFAADSDGLPHMPRIGHEKMLKRLAAADDRIEDEEAGLRNITELLGRLTVQHDTIMVRPMKSC